MPALRWNIEDPEHSIYRKGNDMKHSPATPNMRRWSAEKLDMEMAFAAACADNDWPETVEWLERIQQEISRRFIGEAE